MSINWSYRHLKKSLNSTRKVEFAVESKMKVAFSLLTCTNERNNCLVKTRCFKLDWLLGLGCVEEWRFLDPYQALQLPFSGWRNLESKQTAAAPHTPRDETQPWFGPTHSKAWPQLFPPYSTATYPPPMNSSLICSMKTTHKSSDDKRNHLHLSTLHPPSRIRQIPQCFQPTFYTIPPSASNPLFMCLPKPCPSPPPPPPKKSTSLPLYYNREDTLVG
jgi:hypothetical protein